MSERTEHLLRELVAAIREEVAVLPDNILTLGEELEIARRHASMTLQEVADASWFTKSHVWEVEKGRSRNPTIGMVAGLSRALGVPFQRLAQAALNSSVEPTLSGAQRSELTRSAPDEPLPPHHEGGR